MKKLISLFQNANVGLFVIALKGRTSVLPEFLVTKAWKAFFLNLHGKDTFRLSVRVNHSAYHMKVLTQDTGKCEFAGLTAQWAGLIFHSVSILKPDMLMV
jgi:hypothetical protein